MDGNFALAPKLFLQLIYYFGYTSTNQQYYTAVYYNADNDLYGKQNKQ